MIHSLGTPGRGLVAALALLLTAAPASAQTTRATPAAMPAATKPPAMPAATKPPAMPAATNPATMPATKPAAMPAATTPAAAPMASTTPASDAMANPMPLLKLSDTITLRAGRCLLVSDSSDVERPRDPSTPQRCLFQDNPAGMTTVMVPGNKDENVLFQYKITPDGTIVGGACREGMNQGAYSCTITGKTRPGTKPGGLMAAGAVIRVMEKPGSP